MIAKCHFSAQDILSAAGDHICQRAAEVGIDGTRLLRDLPAPGRLLKGAALPVLARRYRGASCALLHINYTNNGQEWPFLLLMTFKDGGARTHFNGLRWLCQHDGREQRYEPTRYCVSIRQHDHRIEQCERKNRLRRHRALQHSYANGQALPVTHSWLRRRLCGLADASLLRRTTLRTTANGILAPLVHADGSCVGFHQITPHNKGDTKRHFVHTLGAMAGAFVFLASTVKDITLPPILCEGLVTGLTLALYWQARDGTPRPDDVTVFVHLLDADETVVAGHDNPPCRGTCPVSTWQPGEVIRDEYTLQVPASLSPGDYRIEIGMYDPQTLTRLPVAGVGDRLILASYNCRATRCVVSREE